MNAEYQKYVDDHCKRAERAADVSRGIVGLAAIVLFVILFFALCRLTAAL